MTTDSNLNDHSHLQFHSELSNGKVEDTNESTGAMDMVKRDRFELLSAYLDGEVTAVERKQVEDLLANDPAVKSLYARLLKLRQGLRTMPIPQPQAVEETVQQVMARLHRRRLRLALVWGGTAIAATVIGAISGLLSGGELTAPRLAQKPSVEQAQPTKQESVGVSSLMVAINNPILAIPKVAETLPEKKVDQQKELQPLDQQPLDQPSLDIENGYH